MSHPSVSVKCRTAVLSALEKHEGRISTNALAAEINVNRATVIRALKVLQTDRLIVVAQAGCGRGHVAVYTLVKGDKRVTSSTQRVTIPERVAIGLNAGEEELQKGDIKGDILDSGPRAREVLAFEVQVLEDQELKNNPPCSPPQQNSQTILAAFIDQARADGVFVSRQLIGQLASNIKKLLEEGATPEQVVGGLRRMVQGRKIMPSLLGQFVMEAQLPEPERKRFGVGLTPRMIIELGKQPKPVMPWSQF